MATLAPARAPPTGTVPAAGPVTIDAFQINRFDVTDIVPVGYAIFAMALGICAGTLLRRTIPALAVTLAGFAALRALTALWLRPHYKNAGHRVLQAHGALHPSGLLPGRQPEHPRPERQGPGAIGLNGVPVPAACQQFMGKTNANLDAALSCMSAHGYRGYVTYQPASRF